MVRDAKGKPEGFGFQGKPIPGGGREAKTMTQCGGMKLSTCER